MKKILFFITALLLMGGLNANATKLYADLSAASAVGGNVGSSDGTIPGWQASESGGYVFTWHGSYDARIMINDIKDGIATYEKLVIVAPEFTDAWRVDVEFTYGGTKTIGGAYYSAGSDKVITLSEKLTTDERKSIANIRINTASGAGSLRIAKMYLEKPTEFKFNDAGKAYLYPSDLSATSWGLDSYDSETGIVTKSSAGYGGLSFDFGEEGYDFSDINNIEISIDGEYDDIREYASVTDLNSHTQWLSATTAPYTLGNNIDSNIKSWYLGLNEKTGSMKINYICFTSNVMKARLGEEAEMSTLTSYHWNSGSSAFEPTGYTPSYRVYETTGAAYFGVDYSGENCQNYTDVEGYKAIRIYSAKGNVPRAMFFNSSATNQQQFNFVWNDKGYYELLLSEVYSSVSNYKLISVRPQQYTSSFINGIYMVTNDAIYDYTVFGSGIITSSVSAAFEDENATSYDCTGVTATGLNAAPANENSLFKAPSAETFANATSVIVNGVCDLLSLVDGGGTFKAPEAFTASSVSYDRSFTAGQPSTVCLPYALTSEEVAAAGEFYELTGVDGSELIFNKVAETEAYKPYIFKAKSDGALANLSNKTVSASSSAELSYEVEGYTFKGVLSHSSDVAADNPGKTVYGWNAENGAFVKVGDGVAINAFRAYLTISNVNPARLAAKFVDDSVTGINEVNSSETKNADGKYFENGKIVIIKNGAKFSAAGAKLY